MKTAILISESVIIAFIIFALTELLEKAYPEEKNFIGLLCWVVNMIIGFRLSLKIE